MRKMESNFLAFKLRMEALHGPEGREWVDSIPERVEKIQMNWEIQVEPPLEGLNYNYIAPAILSGGKDAVLKLGFPDTELECEARSLEAFDGEGAVRIFKVDFEQGALLLERIRPAANLVNESDEEVIEALMYVVKRLHRPPPSIAKFPTVEDWGHGFIRHRDCFQGTAGPFPAVSFERAEAIYHELAGSMGDRVLLHGDLHHENILTSEREPWLAIDPQGVVGEWTYEIGAFLRNPMPSMLEWDGLEARIYKRIDLLSEAFPLEAERITGWGYAQTVLAAIWSLEENLRTWKDWIPVVDILEQILFEE